MTAPQPQPESATSAIIWEHAAELLAAEEAAAHLATVALRLKLAGISRLFQGRWNQVAPTGRSSGVGVIRLMADLARELLHLPPIPADRLVSAAEDAYRTGVRQAYAEAGLHPQFVALPADGGIVDAIAQAAVDAQDAAGRAAQIARATSRGTPATVERIVSVARQGASSVDRSLRTLVNEQANSAARDVAADVGARPMWVAERNACATCLALSGHFPGPDGLFDASLTFGPHPLEWTPVGGLTQPPRHPRCRCRCTPYFGDDLSPSSFPMVLRRESERSIMHGWALPSEPDSIRQQAASRLLTRIVSHHGTAPSGWKVPKSVEKSTEKRLRKGTFGVTPFPGK
jgi:hypothetical protein